MKTIRIGSGAGYSGDRIEPAIELAEKGNIDYLVFECLAERTIAIAQQAKMKNSTLGYDPLLEARMLAVLEICRQKKIKIITNMGAANPPAAMQKIKQLAESKNIKGLKIAAMGGDDVLEEIVAGGYKILETGEQSEAYKDKMLSANAYLGAKSIVEALQNGADVVITGRVADPALFAAPMIYEFGWDMDNYDLMGKATCLGHLMECAGQVTGGYFSDPGCKDVEGLEVLGFPIAEVLEDASFFITKVPGSGGMITEATCKEQLIYELHNPKAYLTPDVVADFSKVKFKQIATDKIAVEGATGYEKPPTYKVSIGYLDSWIGEGQISYAGQGAQLRGQQALKIVKNRFSLYNAKFTEEKYDLIGINSLHGDTLSEGCSPYEVRARVTCRCTDEKTATLVGNEVETLYTNGPYGGGGASKAVRQVVGVVSTLLDRSLVKPSIEYEVT